MNRRFIVFLVLTLQVSVSFGQSVKNDSLILKSKISIKKSQTSLVDILTEIQENYDVNFSYTDDLISLGQIVNINAENQPLFKILNQLFSGTSIRYVLIGKQIVLAKSKLNDGKSQILLTIPSKDSITSKGKNKEMTSFKLDSKNMKNIKEWEKRNKIRNRSNHLALKFNLQKQHADSSVVLKDSLERNGQLIKNKHKKNNIGKNNFKYFSLDINFTAGSSFRKLISNSEEGISIINQRNEEKGRFGFNSELICSYNLSRFFSLGTGLGIMKSSANGNINYIEHTYIPSGNRIENISYTNNYSYLTIPFLTGYSFYTRSFSLKLIAGILPSALIATNKRDMEYYNYDYYFDYNNSNVWQQQGMKAPEKVRYRKFNLGYSLRAEGNYKKGKMGIAIGINYIHFLSSTYVSAAPIKEKIILPGIYLSLKYYF